MRKLDIAWAAGLFEGEGTFVVRQGKYPMLALQMCDRDVVEKFAEIVGCGSVRTYTRSKGNPKHSDTWFWQVGNRKDCLRIAKAFLPHLGERRRAKAESVIEASSRVDGRSLRYK